MPPQMTQIEYQYKKSEEANLSSMLEILETQIGGERRPYDLKASALDLLRLLEIGVSFIAGAVVTTVVSKYLEGLLDTDSLIEHGKRHRKQLFQGFAKLEQDISMIVQAFERAYKTPVPIAFKGKPMAVAICFHVSKPLYIVLNHEGVSPKLLLNLPKGVVRALRYLAETSTPRDAEVFQLYFDKTSESWKYLFMPTPKAFGRWIDRYADLETNEIISISSRNEFIKKFQPSENDQFKFLICPFRKVAD